MLRGVVGTSTTVDLVRADGTSYSIVLERRSVAKLTSAIPPSPASVPNQPPVPSQPPPAPASVAPPVLPTVMPQPVSQSAAMLATQPPPQQPPSLQATSPPLIVGTVGLIMKGCVVFKVLPGYLFPDIFFLFWTIFIQELRLLKTASSTLATPF